MSSEDKNIKAVAKGTRRRKSTALRLADVFVEEDLEVVKQNVMQDVIIPGIKEIIANTLTDTINMVLFGDTKRSTSSKNNRTPYGSAYTNRTKRSSSSKITVTGERRSRGRGYTCDDVIVESRGEAEEIIDSMFELMDTYDGVASVADLYDLAAMDTKHTDNNWGWDDLSGVSIKRLARNEYLIKMPKPIQINS